VIVVGFDFSAVQGVGRDSKHISLFDNHCPTLLQFRVQGLNPFALLNPQPPEVHESLRTVREGRQDNCGHDAVTEVVPP
jgi:hypothetical protein